MYKITKLAKEEFGSVGTISSRIIRGSQYSHEDFEQVFIERGVRQIGEAAFYNCLNLKEVNIPDTVTDIGFGAFENCRQLQTIVMPFCDNIEYISFIFGGDNYEDIYKFPYSIKNMTITSGIIPEWAFYECPIKNLTIAAGVRDIHARAFLGCSELEQVTFEPGIAINSIEHLAFSNCTELKKIELPNGVTSIEDRAFAYCDELEEVVLPKTIEYIDADAFEESGKIVLRVPAGMNLSKIVDPNFDMSQVDVLYY